MVRTPPLARAAGALALACLIIATGFAQAPATTPFPSWTAALQRAAAGGENARVAFIGDSNLDQPRGFYLPLRSAFEAQAAGAPGSATGGAGVAALTGFLINDLEISRTVGAWSQDDDARGLADQTQVSVAAGDTLSVTGTRAPSLFDRATVHLDRVPGGGTARVEFHDATGALLHAETVDLDGAAGGASVAVSFDGFAFAAGNRVTVRTLAPRSAGVRLLAVVTDRRPNNSVQVHKIAYAGFNAQVWSRRLTTSALQGFLGGLDLAIVSLGTNDMRRGDPRAYRLFEEGMSEILAYFRAAGVPVIVAAPADMAPVVSNNGPPRDFDEETMRITLRRLCATYGAAYFDLGTLHGDHAQILRDGIYRPSDPYHFQAYSVDDPASRRHGDFFYAAAMGLPTADRSAGNTPAPTPSALAEVTRCGPTVVREVDGSGVPAYVTFRAPAPDYRILAEIRNDVALGEVRLETFQEFRNLARTSPGGFAYGPRQFTLTSAAVAAATIRLPVAAVDLAAFGLTEPEEVRWFRTPSTADSWCAPYDDRGGVREGLADVIPIGSDGHLLEFGVAGFSQFFQVPTAAPLPVELISFAAEPRAAGTRLRWATASEVGFSHFAIERSADGTAWTQVGEVLAKAATCHVAAATRAPTAYRFDDYGSVGAGGATTYYRLGLHDGDGTVAHSEVVAVAWPESSGSGAAGLSLAPNPASGVVEVTLPKSCIGQRLVVRDLAGRTVRELVVAAETERIEVVGMAAGVYTVGVSGVPGLVRLVVR